MSDRDSEEPRCTYAFLEFCNDADSYKRLLSDALTRARREGGRLIAISILCPGADYNSYLLTANEVTANNMDSRIELYEVSGAEGAVKVFGLLVRKCAPARVYSGVDAALDGVEAVRL